MDSCTESINLYFKSHFKLQQEMFATILFYIYSPFPLRPDISDFNKVFTCTVRTKLIWFLLPPVINDSRYNQNNGKKQK